MKPNKKILISSISLIFIAFLFLFLVCIHDNRHSNNNNNNNSKSNYADPEIAEQVIDSTENELDKDGNLKDKNDQNLLSKILDEDDDNDSSSSSADKDKNSATNKSSNDENNSNNKDSKRLDGKDIENKDNLPINEKTKNYIIDNANRNYINPNQIKIASIMEVKQTIAYRDKISETDTLDSILSTDDWMEKVYAVLPAYVAVYDLDENSDYFIAYTNSMLNDSNAKMQDYAFARNNTCGEVLDECIYDEKTGLSYIPKKYYVKDDTFYIDEVQMQILQSENFENMDEATSNVEVATTNESKTTYGEGNVDIFNFNVTAKTEKNLDKSEFIVAVNGIPLNEDGYDYNASTGEVSVNKSSVSIQSLDIILNKKNVVSKVVDDLKPLTAMAADEAVKSADGMNARGDVNINPNLKKGAWKQLDQYVSYGNGGNKDYGYYYGIGTSGIDSNLSKLYKMIWDNNGYNSLDYSNIKKAHTEMNIYIWFNGARDFMWCDSVKIYTECAHITSGLGYANPGGNWKEKVMPIGVRILDINTTSSNPYVVAGFLTPTMYKQCGMSIVKFNIANYTPYISQWMFGFTQGEGNNGGSNTAYKIAENTFMVPAYQTFNINTNRSVAVPKGFKLKDQFWCENASTYYNFNKDFTSDRNWRFQFHYDPINYNITYDLDGGTNNSNNPSTYNVIYSKQLYAPTKSGCKFEGWTQENNLLGDGKTHNYTFTNDVSGNRYNYSKIQLLKVNQSNKTWEYSNEVAASSSSGHFSTKYNHNGNSGIYTIRLGANGNNKDNTINIYNVYFENGAQYQVDYDLQYSQQKIVMNNVSIKRITPINQINKGKSGSALASSNYYAESCTRQIGDLKLKANWSKNNITITYDGNGATSGYAGSQSGAAGATFTIAQNSFTKTGYTFTGWNTKADGTGDKYEAGKKYVINSNLILYAQWESINEYTIKYHYPILGTSIYDGKWNSSDDEQTIEKAKKGSNYTIWDISKDYSNNDILRYEAVCWSTKNSEVYDFGDYIKPNKDLDLYLQLEPLTYLIKYNGNSNTGGHTNNTKLYFDKSSNVSYNGFTRTGYTFTGWNTKADGSGDKYDENQSVKNLVENQFSGDFVLYAQWKPNQYTNTLNYNANGGTEVPDNQSENVTYPNTQSKFTISSTKPTYKGHTFLGWYDAKNGGNKIGSTVTVGSNNYTGNQKKTIYAHWSKNSYNLKIDPNGGYRVSDNNTSVITISKDYGSIEDISERRRTGYTLTGYTMKNSNNGSTTDLGGATFTFNSTTKTGVFKQGTVPITLVAQWSKNSYNIVYYGNKPSNASNNIVGSTPTSTHYYGQSKKLTKNGFRLKGWKFCGWSTTNNEDSIPKYHDEESVIDLTDKNNGVVYLYAIWEQDEYNIVYKPNGSNECSELNQTRFFDMVYKLHSNSNNRFIRTGYKLTGWNDKADGTGKHYDLGEKYKNLADPGKTKILYAEWTPNNYTVTYNGNGATGGSMSPSTATYDTDFITRKNAFTRTGYTFVGWNEAPDGSGTAWTLSSAGVYESGKSWKWTYDKDITLYAQWKSNHYKLTVNPNNGTLPDGTTTDKTLSPDLIYDSDNWWNINNQTPTRTGYTFTGWNTKADGSGINVYDANGSCIDGCGYWKNKVYKGTSDLKVYAQWSKNSYNIVYYGNKPSNASNNIVGSTPTSTHYYGQSKKLTKNGFRLKGWTFTGWNTDPNGKGQSYQDQQSVLNLVDKDKGSLTLYAQWRQNIYTIVYDKNKPATAVDNVTGTTPNSSHVYDQAKNLTKNGYSLKGWTFTGWNDKADGSGKSYSDQQSVKNLAEKQDANVILYAQWRANVITIQFNANSGVNDNPYYNSNAKTYFKKDRSEMITKSSSSNGNYTIQTQKFKYDDTSLDLWNISSFGLRKTGYHINSSSAWRLVSKNGLTLNQDGTTKEQMAAIRKYIENGDATITVYANWIANTYTIHFEGNRNTSGSMSDIKATYDQPIKLTPNAFERIGYKFDSWNLKQNGSGTKFNDGQEVINLTATNNGTVTLYAQWKLNINIKLDVRNDIYHVGDTVTKDNVRETLKAIITDKTSGEDITNAFDKDAVQKIELKKTVDTDGNSYNLNSNNLDTSKENHFKITYELKISDTGITESDSIVQKVTVIKDIEDIKQEIPDGSKTNTDPIPPAPDNKDPLVPGGIDTSDGSNLNVTSDIRYISKKYLPTLNKDSKWKTDPTLFTELKDTLNKEANDDNAIYVIEISKDKSDEIKEWLFNDKTWDNQLNKDLIDTYGSDIIKKKP